MLYLFEVAHHLGKSPTLYKVRPGCTLLYCLQARGDVLEVGVGTGLNLPFYNWSNMTTLTGADISEGMLREAAARVQSAANLQQANLTSLVQADVTQLPFPDCSFDAVVDTFSLCVFARPQEALAEMARVLRPGGRLLLVEHSRSDNPVLGAYMVRRGCCRPLRNAGTVLAIVREVVPGHLAPQSL